MPGPGGVPWQAVYAAGPAGWQHAQQALAAAAATGFRSGGGGGGSGAGPVSGGWSPQQYEQYMVAMQQYGGGAGGPPPPGLPPYAPSMGGGGPPPPPPAGGGGDWRQQLLQQQQGNDPQQGDLSSLNQAEVSTLALNPMLSTCFPRLPPPPLPSSPHPQAQLWLCPAHTCRWGNSFPRRLQLPPPQLPLPPPSWAAGRRLGSSTRRCSRRSR